MIVKMDATGLKETKWHEYAVRFLLGGLITSTAGFIAHKWGPSIGGLFLAFPAIFPASATLVEKHERKRKEQKGLQGEKRGRNVAADDAMGAALGSVGLLLFAWICWSFIAYNPAVLVLASALLAWLVTAVLIWIVRKRFPIEL
jgi:hypothetical protein